MNMPLATPSPLPVAHAAAGGGLIIFDVEEMVRRAQAIKKVQETLMKPGIHFYTLSSRKVDGVDTPTWSLGKPGAELLCLTFGLSADLSSEVLSDVPDHKATIMKKEWRDDPDRPGKRVYDEHPVDIVGLYEVKSTCSIYSPSGVLLARASGVCNSHESCFSGTPYWDSRNPILKRAEKRAFVAAVILATGCSDMFTQDLEDLDEAIRALMLGEDDKAKDKAKAQGQPQAKAQGQGQGQTQTQTQTQGQTQGLAWFSDGRRRLLFAKGKARGHSEAVVKAMIEKLEAHGEKGKGFFDIVADDKPQADGMWAAAVEAAGKVSVPPPPPPASDPLPPPPPASNA